MEDVGEFQKNDLEAKDENFALTLDARRLLEETIEPFKVQTPPTQRRAFNFARKRVERPADAHAKPDV